jgi:thioredoxin 1
MGPLCIPVYRIAEELETEYIHVKFFDMEYDNPELYFFHELPALKDLPEHPFTVCFKNGEAVKAIGGIQSKAQMRAMLDENLAVTISV